MATPECCRPSTWSGGYESIFYEPGRRSGLWVKHRINASQEFVIGDYVPSHLAVDSIVIGFYRDKPLCYAARVRAGFVPLTRRQVFERIKLLETGKCPFVNLPEKKAGRWGQELHFVGIGTADIGRTPSAIGAIFRIAQTTDRARDAAVKIDIAPTGRGRSHRASGCWCSE